MVFKARMAQVLNLKKSVNVAALQLKKDTWMKANISEFLNELNNTFVMDI